MQSANTKINFLKRFYLFNFGTRTVIRIKNLKNMLENGNVNVSHFPPDFKFGTCTVSYQVEGRGREDGKGISMWDEFSQNHPKNILDRSNARTTCDSYHNFLEDVLMLKSMNATSYNFSLNWSRILPDGTTRYINRQGLDYYDDLINTLLENGLEPIVTLTDLDLPLPLLQKYAGGWMNRKLIQAFESYAKLCFAKFGDRVQYWITFPPAWTHSWNSYSVGIHPPNLSLGLKGAYLAFTNLLKAHALVYRLYEKRFKQNFGAKVGIAVDCDSKENSSMAYQLGRLLHPLKHGKCSAYHSTAVAAASPEVELDNCKQLIMHDEWLAVLKGAFDFVALHFTPEISVKLESCKISMKEIAPPQKQQVSSMRSVLNCLKTEYGNPEVLVFCQGPQLALPTQMMDIDRAQYFNQVAKWILEARIEDQCNVTGYFPGKLMDCWEWDSGFTMSYGLFHVDFSSREKKRAPRASVVFVLKHLFREKKPQMDLF